MHRQICRKNLGSDCCLASACACSSRQAKWGSDRSACTGWCASERRRWSDTRDPTQRYSSNSLHLRTIASQHLLPSRLLALSSTSASCWQQTQMPVKQAADRHGTPWVFWLVPASRTSSTSQSLDLTSASLVTAEQILSDRSKSSLAGVPAGGAQFGLLQTPVFKQSLAQKPLKIVSSDLKRGWRRQPETTAALPAAPCSRQELVATVATLMVARPEARGSGIFRSRHSPRT